MQFVADFHIHSKYSRAVSQNMVLSEMEKWAVKKGIDVLSAADFTHPLWFRELKAQLVQDSEGIYRIKNSEYSTDKGIKNAVRFILSTEISSIYSQGGKTRRVHNLIFMPSLESVEKFNSELLKRGANLSADGRPIIGLSSRNLLELVLLVDQKAFLIPCHAWTPWFSLYGSNSGFDSIEECFQDLSSHIYGIETGLSSDPEMNWRIKELDNRSILSFSDAHSAIKMGREATVFETSDQSSELSFSLIKDAIRNNPSSNLQALKAKIAYTIEFYPEEGKYHFTGHRVCGIKQTPQETEKNGVVCSVCKRPLTVGVMHRVEKLASRQTNIKVEIDELGVSWVSDPTNLHPKYVKLVPLVEILAESLSVMPGSLKVLSKFDEMISHFGSELNILLKTPVSEIEKMFGVKIANGIAKVRKQDIYVDPGFDGEFGKVRIWSDEILGVQSEKPSVEDQLGLF